jgi:hypothetical protein
MDSTYWVTGDDAGLRLRRAPLTLSRAGDRFFELFVADDDRSFYDAVLVGQRLYRRDLLTGDSAVVLADTVVPRLARGYAAAHPTAEPLDEEEEPSEQPALVANAELGVVAIHGPYASYEYHTDVETRDAGSRYAARRGVVDWRTGRPVTLAALFGEPGAVALLAEGRRRFAAALDSIERSADPRAADARAVLADFAFDERSFGLEAVDGRPAVAFFAPGSGDEAGGMGLPLAPVVAPASPGWWTEVRAALAEPGGAEADERWRGPRYALVARYASDTVAQLVLVDGSRGEWAVGAVQPPIERVLWLDRPPLDAPTRLALQRAFDESALYDDAARLITHRRPRAARPPRPRRATLVSHRRTAPVR